MPKLIGIHDSSGFNVLGEVFFDIAEEDLDKKKYYLFPLPHKLPGRIFEEFNFDTLVWAPSPFELINPYRIFEESPLIEENWFNELKREKFTGKRILYLSEGFILNTNKETYKELAEEVVIFPEVKPYSNLIEAIRNYPD